MRTAIGVWSMNDQEFVKSQKLLMLGDLEVGGERGYVFDKNGLCPSESATQHKDPIKVMEWKKL